jgi:hypothetical protein
VKEAGGMEDETRVILASIRVELEKWKGGNSSGRVNNTKRRQRP